MAVARLVFAARDLVNEPPSIATPSFIAKHAERLAVDTPGLKLEVWSGPRLERERLAGLMAVARGAGEEPRFIQLRYAPPGAKRRVALVGKGITFDSGGLSLKPSKSMETMKYDMAGAATVLSAVTAAARLRLPVAVTAYAPATENLPGERAQKPGDVITFMNGKTAEVLNTDAEGRLILADALALASKTKPDVVVDVATLTGAARVALGNAYAAVLGNDQPTIEALIAAGRAVGEPLWQLPLAREYKDDIRSTIADVKNVGGGEGGTITAALFLEEFVGDTKWAHLDIAGPAFAERETTLAGKGATAFGVRLLVEWLRAQSA
jgi:leucyl aminopeptidase